ncbi:hypothetical protein BT63DRAFT_419644 [Microthyrium microscopicum]|uniref:General transcription and DNA repair factor IIH subunit TFB5 n=1 Tax=Microthyrium microscopicum TaxID=703497 RepID=A0A6A6UPY4_9PEZI|nr:hypothetical protein BT63DRAFT_419644 [Microthyrium microscopicum]
MVKAVKGILVQCDESIKAIIEKIDKENGNTFILEALDDENLLISSGKINELKARLKSVLTDTVKEHEEPESNSDNNEMR